MKKYLCFMIILCLILSGCNRNHSENLPTTPPAHQTEPTQLPPPAEDPTQESIVIPQQPMFAVSVPIQTEYTIADDETVICSYSYQTIDLEMHDQEIAERIIGEFESRQEILRSNSAYVAQQAQSEYRPGNTWQPYFYNAIYSPARIDHSVLSLYGKSVQYSGGNHPYQECIASNYNLKTGEVLTLGSIITNISSKDKLCEALVENAAYVAEHTQLYDDYAQIISDRFAIDESYDEGWFFSSTGLSFFFSPYEIGPYISGSVVIEIPYNQLHGIILDTFLPAEEPLYEGNLIVQHADETDLDDFTQIAEIPTAADGETFVLYSDGLIRDVAITTDNGTTIFRAYTLTPGDGILLSVNSQETAQYQLSYRCGDKSFNQVITFDEEGKSFSLSEASGNNPV